MDAIESSEMKTEDDESEVHWLSGVFYKSAYIILLFSWIHSFTASYTGYNVLALFGEYDDLDVDENTTSYVDGIDTALLTHPAHRLEMRDVATCLFLVTLCLKVWPRSVQTPDTLSHTERMLLCDIRSKEKLIGFLRAKIQCSLVRLKEVTSLVKISRDKLEVQRVENKTIIDQLEYFAQIGQMRQ